MLSRVKLLNLFVSANEFNQAKWQCRRQHVLSIVNLLYYEKKYEWHVICFSKILALFGCIALHQGVAWKSNGFLDSTELILPAVIFVKVSKCTDQILLLFQFMFIHHGSKELCVINAATLIHVNLHRPKYDY
jgi:hypothetical protein